MPMTIETGLFFFNSCPTLVKRNCFFCGAERQKAAGFFALLSLDAQQHRGTTTGFPYHAFYPNNVNQNTRGSGGSPFTSRSRSCETTQVPSEMSDGRDRNTGRGQNPPTGRQNESRPPSATRLAPSGSQRSRSAAEDRSIILNTAGADLTDRRRLSPHSRDRLRHPRMALRFYIDTQFYIQDRSQASADGFLDQLRNDIDCKSNRFVVHHNKTLDRKVNRTPPYFFPQSSKEKNFS